MNDFQPLSDLNLVIIGAGAWGKKLLNIFELHVANCLLVSARDFLLKPTIIDVFNQNSICWVSTSPDFQIRILDKLIKKNTSTVILEKPYFASSEELYKLKHLLTNSLQTAVYLSEPWLHSALWKDARAAILDLHSNSERTQILIHRFSSDRREYINPIQDWMPHDLSLIFDLKAHLEQCELSILAEPVIKEDLMQGSFRLGKRLSVDFSIGYSTGSRTGKWLISNENKFIEVDFVGLRIEPSVNVKDYLRLNYTQDNPVVNQLNWITSRVSDSDIMNKLNLQKEFLY
jgi:hypothetical protein